MAALCGGVVAAAGPARGQASDPELRPTRGPFITGAQRAGDADATAVELNPGALGLLRSGSLELVGAGSGAGGAISRRGAGLYWATPLLGSALGFGLSRVAGDSTFGVEGHTVLRVAFALRLGRSNGFGASWGHIWDGTFGGTDTFDFGLSQRFGRYLAAGVVVEDVGTPRPSSLPVSLRRLWAAEILLRPLGTTRLELAIGAAHAEDDAWRRFVPRARLSAVLLDGLRLYAEGQSSPRGDALAFEGGSDTRIGVGLALDLDHVGAMLGGYLYEPGAGDRGFGGALRLRIYGERQPALVSPGYVARVALDDVDDDRAFLSLVRRLRGLAIDKGVAGVLFKIESLKFGVARIEEVRDLIAMLRSHGKATFAYVPRPSTRHYYLAAATDAIILHPASQLALVGISQNVTFYKGGMDRIGIRVDLVRIGEFKGAMEPFIMTEQSPEVRQNKERILDDVFARLVQSIAADRTRSGHRLDAGDVRGLIDKGLFTPGEAQLAGLVDAVAPEKDLETLLGRAFKLPKIEIRDPDPSPLAPAAWPSRRIAVVFVDGTITDGPSQELPFDLGSVAGSDTLVKSLEECRRDPRIGAVVLRVNSPGGSAFASDVLARAVQELRDSGKPVIASMGDSAASGGYYISAPTTAIYASPSTLSGSIGIFGSKVDVAKLMEMLSLNVETYRRGTHADYLSPYRAWTADEVKIALEKIRHLYGLFVDTVVAGRKAKGLTAARVDELGRGRVWTGALAQSVGLVDKLGGLSEAIDEAARQSGVPLGRDRLPEIEVLPKRTVNVVLRAIGLAQGLGEGEGGKQKAPAISPAALLTPEGRAALRMLAPLVLEGGVTYQARMPFDVEIR